MCEVDPRCEQDGATSKYFFRAELRNPAWYQELAVDLTIDNMPPIEGTSPAEIVKGYNIYYRTNGERAAVSVDGKSAPKPQSLSLLRATFESIQQLVQAYEPYTPAEMLDGE
jgi:hypothetical protein